MINTRPNHQKGSAEINLPLLIAGVAILVFIVCCIAADIKEKVAEPTHPVQNQKALTQ